MWDPRPDPSPRAPPDRAPCATPAPQPPRCAHPWGHPAAPAAPQPPGGGSSSRGPRPRPLTPQGVPPLAGWGREVLGARGTGLGAAGTASAVSVSAAVPVNMYANPFLGDPFLQYSCPVELQGSFTLSPERQQPPEQPPDPRTSEQRSPSAQNLQSPGPTVTPMPTTPMPVTPMPVTPVPVTPIPATPVPVTPIPAIPVPATPIPATPVPPTPIPVTPIPVTPIPVTPVAPMPPEPLSPEQQQQPLDLRLPDVRRKDPSRKMPRAAERPPATPQTPQGASHRGRDGGRGSERTAPPPGSPVPWLLPAPVLPVLSWPSCAGGITSGWDQRVGAPPPTQRITPYKSPHPPLHGEIPSVGSPKPPGAGKGVLG